ncbi:thiol reductant ABC exporter subunit CydC [Acetobacter orleanensis]|uniref:Thiol reductant ABC exporter subunit CydC n=1 Tax=Acetobacter orleanensis TaxID=104099 RepID=A0A4Y3TH08_9PROT|nr:thiol reductant ABC exporter subunit CydC [Acetobacter orleanensis]KXV63144.1 ABC transporter ATP-binding protein [Acetobacter orleanensis]PCD80229.1 thiol reductant ABC exporter subunit CydC [Acetobacter orleanensis]GAN69036.1 ABC transporter cysteine exporter CydCD [Acetobacter orleanensis JCM 7639]GBR30344.1 transport ATP-binding protein CydD [Acetobacter orleanensis NRIC 0473]GEB81556.1 thiol reductant ABC exporter subunit CydC [Acetobacter orleanensis]
MKTSHQEDHTRALTDCQAVLRILRLWQRQAPRLIIGVMLALIALCLGLVLMQASGLRLASSVLGEVVITTALLRWLGIGRVVLRYAERLFAHDAMFRALADLRVWFFHSLAEGAAAGLGFRRAGDMLSRLVSDIGTLDGLYLRILLPFACACLTLPVLVVQLGQQSVLLGTLVGVLFACSAFVVPYLIARSSRAEGERLAKNLAALRIGVLDLVGGLREIRAFGAEGRILAHVQADDAALLAGQMKLARRAAYANASAFLCGQAAIFLVLLAAAGAFSLHLSALAAVGTLFLTVAAFESAGALTRAGLQAGVMGAAARRVVEVAGHAPTASHNKALIEAPADTHIHLEGVTFRWAPDRPLVFDGLTLDIPAGSRVAILGPSGVGKSSLAALLLKAATPEAGTITLGGKDIADIRAESLRQRMAWLSQATHLFDDSIRANLLLGRPDATEEDLWKALEDAAVADVVRTLPDGLDTWLGEGGIKLSGGQGRRIALARTLLTQAPILILDEPATGLDAQTEQDFLRTLNTVTEGRTVILIAHRLTGVETLDRIWRLSGGVAAAAAA